MRIALALSPYATIRDMKKLSNDTDVEVIGALCRNPSTPEYIQKELEHQLKVIGIAKAKNDGGGCSSLHNSTDDSQNQYYRYDGTHSPYHVGVIEHDVKSYDVMDDSDYGGETMYFDEDNGWLTELP